MHTRGNVKLGKKRSKETFPDEDDYGQVLDTYEQKPYHSLTEQGNPI